MPEEAGYQIGRLRWQVQLATRQQETSGLLTGTGIAETLVNAQTVHADIQPVGALTYWGLGANGMSEQVDAPITHRIFMRWQDSVPNTSVVVRQTLLPDGGQRNELFRVRRIREIAGRKRFVILECELESESWPPVT